MERLRSVKEARCAVLSLLKLSAKSSNICSELAPLPVYGGAPWSARDARASRVSLTPILTLV